MGLYHPTQALHIPVKQKANNLIHIERRQQHKLKMHIHAVAESPVDPLANVTYSNRCYMEIVGCEPILSYLCFK